MFRVRVATVGRCKERWLREALEEYTSRLTGRMAIEWIECRDDAQLVRAVIQERAFVCLDPAGRVLDSAALSSWLMKKLSAAGGRLTFAIGGPEGLPKTLRDAESLSLSALTLTHQMVRLLLIEQLYRALEIARGGPYHR